MPQNTHQLSFTHFLAYNQVCTELPPKPLLTYKPKIGVVGITTDYADNFLEIKSLSEFP